MQAEYEELRAKEAEARIEAEEQERIAKRPRHEDLTLAVLVGGEEEDTKGELVELQQKFPDIESHSGANSSHVSDDTTQTADTRAAAGLKKELQDLRVVSRAKVTLNRIYSAAYHPDVQKDLIFFGGMVFGFYIRSNDSDSPMFCRQARTAGNLGCASTAPGSGG